MWKEHWTDNWVAVGVKTRQDCKTAMHRAHSMEESKHCDGYRLQLRLGAKLGYDGTCTGDRVLVTTWWLNLRHVATIGQTTCKKTRCTYKTSVRARMQSHSQWGRGGHAHKVQRGPRGNVGRPAEKRRK